MPRFTRQSARLQTASANADDGTLLDAASITENLRRKRKPSTLSKLKRMKPDDVSDSSNSTASKSDHTSAPSSDSKSYCLPRNRETTILQNSKTNYTHVIGIDEAGRGPLAGPVVAAAVCAPIDIDGIFDSKQITKEQDRERIYEEVVSSHEIQWAVAVVSAARIDEINILQATLEAMTLAATALVTDSHENVKEQASIEHEGCYVVRYCSSDVIEKNATAALPLATTFALIDGNQLPPRMPVAAETIIKGDSKEYCIAVASVLAKVTRDRLMNAYATLYPAYNFSQHKGYPTKAHKEAIAKHGAIAIHRRTFAPLKYMDLITESE
jgi:ribonuclease HII